MVGGFLGAGKTTAVLRLAERFRAEGLRVGLITNDQSHGLVDTRLLGSHGFVVEEITGGCFCCRFQSLAAAADRLSINERPDVFLAEPVGSCTDLKATVDYPLRRMYGADYSIAPLSVLVDPVRAQRVLGLRDDKVFSSKVRYVYEKQLEEADIVVINKMDLLSVDELNALRAILEVRFPQAEVAVLSARTGEGIDAWMERTTSIPARTGEAMEVDYERYADGEALLGWLNCTAYLSKSEPFDGNAAALELAAGIQARLAAQKIEIAHLKLTLTPVENGNDIAVANAVRGDRAPEASHRLLEPLEAGQLILNLRAEGDPETLRAAVLDCFADVTRALGVQVEVEHLERFRPARPTPTYRLAMP